MPTKYEDYTDGTVIADTAGTQAAAAPAMTTMEVVYDATRRNLDAGDSAEVLTIPRGTFVYKVFYEVLDGEAEQTLDVGDDNDSDGFIAAADVAATGSVGVGAGAYAAGRLYTEDTALLIECPTAKEFTTLRVRLVLHVGTLGAGAAPA